MKMMLLLAVVIAVPACRGPATFDPDSIAFIIPRGSKLILEQRVQIPTCTAHIRFQHGRIMKGVDQYTVNCRLRVRNLGPQDVQPDTFLITNAGDGEEWVSDPQIRRYYKKLFLSSDTQPDVTSMMCQVWADPYFGRSVSVPQMREALGDFFSFEFPQTRPRDQGT